MSHTVITRFPPSPTGFLQLGNCRTALFNYLFATQHKGKFTFRFEDTDRARSEKHYEDHIIESLQFLNLPFEGPILHQSERSDVYKKYLQKMIDGGFAYISKEENKLTENGTERRSEVIRFKNPNKKITFTDMIRGDITIDTTDLGDFVIAKSIDEPIYHLAVVIDDHEVGTTHIIRGEDGISNTPRQILIQEAIGAKTPIYAHLPLVLAPDRTKLSKRKGAKSVLWYRDEGYLSEAINNYMALLGWNPGTDQEIFTLQELIAQFDLSKVQKGGAIFNEEKLKWVNKQHILKLPQEELMKYIKARLGTIDVTDEMLTKLVPLILERIDCFGDITKMIEAGELEYVFNEPQYDIEKLYWKDERDAEALKRRLEQVMVNIEGLDPEHFTKEHIKAALWDYATLEGRGQVLWPTRMALSGKDKSPDPFVLAELLGKETTITRLKIALEKISHEVAG